MRQVLAMVIMAVVVGCATESTRTDRGDGTTIVTSGSLKGLVCTNPDCSGIADLTVTGTDLYSVNLARLTSVGSLIINDNSGLARVVLPALTSVSGNLIVSGNQAMTSVSLPALTSVGGHLYVSINRAANSSDGYTSALTSLSLPALTSVGGSLDVSANPALTSLSLPELTTVGGDLTVSGNVGWVYFTSALTSLSLPALTTVGGNLGVTGNFALTSFCYSSLLTTVVGNLTIQDNTSYPQCAAEAILAQLVNFTGTATISRNDTTATCPP